MEEFEDNLLNHVDPVQRRQLRIMYHITCKLKCKVPHPHQADIDITQTSHTEKIWIVRPIVCHSDV